MKKKILLDTVMCVTLVSEILLWYNITIKRWAWLHHLTRWALWFAALLRNFIAALQSLQTIWPYKIQTSSKTFESRFDDSENFTEAVGRDWDFLFGSQAGRDAKRTANATVMIGPAMNLGSRHLQACLKKKQHKTFMQMTDALLRLRPLNAGHFVLCCYCCWTKIKAQDLFSSIVNLNNVQILDLEVC